MKLAWLKKFLPFKEEDRCVCHDDLKTLSDVPTGENVRIECLRGEAGVCQRLREMGFCESSVVVKLAQSGSLICKVCDAKVIISKELGENIIVKNLCNCKGHSFMENKTILLSQLQVGQKGIIQGFAVEGDDCERIEEMGLTPGEYIEVIRYAPMGDPIEIKIRGYHLSLRKDEADQIKVTLLP